MGRPYILPDNAIVRIVTADGTTHAVKALRVEPGGKVAHAELTCGRRVRLRNVKPPIMRHYFSSGSARSTPVLIFRHASLDEDIDA